MRLATFLLALVPFAAARAEDAPPPRVHIDLTGYKTVAELARAAVKPAAADRVPGFVGVEVGSARADLADVAADSPAAAAGLKAGDRVLSVDGEPVESAAMLKEKLRGLSADVPVTLTLAGSGDGRTVTVTPRPASKPFTSQSQVRAVIGIQSGEVRDGGGVDVSAVTGGGAAEKAGVKAGDVVVRVDGVKLEGDTGVREVLALKKPGDVVRLELKRGQDQLEVRATLQADPASSPRAAGWDDRLPGAWKKPAYRLAIIGVEYPDVKHNPKITDADWDAAMFSAGTYHGMSATGQKVHGSMADYYREISYGTFAVEGQFAGWVEVSKKRLEYSSGTGTSFREKTALLVEAFDKLLAKKGKDALAGFDGVFFVYAGDRVNTTRGGLYWPHRASVSHGGKRWPYFIVQEGGSRMTDISVFCHEFGHMLGLPDLYARPEVPGMEGVGPWDAMSQQNGGGRPQHFSAWSKDQLGWVKPVTIDPRIKQKVILSPVESSPDECVKVLVRPDGTEYFLLENRKKSGFDAGLPAEGLLIWRVVPGNGTQRVFLEEAHGITGPTGPRVFLGAVPFPSPANTSFTPTTTPSSKSTLGGGYDVYLTDIRRLPDGRVTFHVGYEYQ